MKDINTSLAGSIFSVARTLGSQTEGRVASEIGQSEADRKFKSLHSFVHNFFFIDETLLKTSTEHGSHTAVLCAKFQKDSSTKHSVMSEQGFVRLEFKNKFWKDWLYCYKAPAYSISFQQSFLSRRHKPYGFRDRDWVQTSY